jgi:D-glycero-alpha-D-manno-heptose 1-phosphate guanylyltransferase
MRTHADITAIVLAGGKGTRIASLYPDRPKPMIPVCGQPFLHWMVLWLAAQGIRQIVISVGYLAEQIESWVRTADIGAEIEVRCRRESAPLGTGGGILNCLDLCGDVVLAVNGDSLVVTDIEPMIRAVVRGAADAAMLGLPVSDAARYGTLKLDAGGRLRQFVEKQPGPGTINCGVYVMRKAMLSHFPRDTALSMEYDIIPKLLADGMRIDVHRADAAPFLDIGTPDALAASDAFIEQHRARLLAGPDSERSRDPGGGRA